MHEFMFSLAKLNNLKTNITQHFSSKFQEHVKTHTEEYKFSCKFCGSAFINRNVMVSHQKSCSLNSEATGLPTQPISVQPQQISPSLGSPPPEKRFKVVLNSDEIKNLIRAKDEEIRYTNFDCQRMYVTSFSNISYCINCE